MSICFAMFSVASQANCSGYPRRFCQSISACAFVSIAVLLWIALRRNKRVSAERG